MKRTYQRPRTRVSKSPAKRAGPGALCDGEIGRQEAGVPQDQGITRRELLRRAAAGAAALGLGRAILGEEAGAAAAASPQSAKVVLVRDGAVLGPDGQVREAVVQAMLDRGLRALTGAKDTAAAWRHLAGPGDRVGVKATLMMTPTHPELLRAICRGLKAAGVADEHLLTWDRAKSGIGEAEVESLPRTLGFGKQDVSEAVWQSTVLINVPRLKAHWLAGMACALKNWAGAVTHINTQDDHVTYAFHADSCREVGMLGAIPAIRQRSRLHIVDALRPLCHGGPQVDPRYLWSYQGLLLSTDPVAVDTIGRAIIEGRRRQVRGGEWPLQPPVTHLIVADRKYGLGVSDRKRITLVKLGLDRESFV
jgi:uncharacterized protein (DUF362 family)